jgi:hypothetical protein
MLCREIIAVRYEMEFVNVKPGGTYSNHRALKISYVTNF